MDTTTSRFEKFVNSRLGQWSSNGGGTPLSGRLQWSNAGCHSDPRLHEIALVYHETAFRKVDPGRYLEC